MAARRKTGDQLDFMPQPFRLASAGRPFTSLCRLIGGIYGAGARLDGDVGRWSRGSRGTGGRSAIAACDLLGRRFGADSRR